jgi:hypothetical protein
VAEKYAIYAGPPVAAALAGYEQSRSSRINQICDEYQQFVSLLCPELPSSQWLAIIDALMGTWIEDEPTLKHLWIDIEEADGLGDKWKIDQPALAASLRAMPVPQLLALREVIRRFRLDHSSTDPIAVLRQAGARVKD